MKRKRFVKLIMAKGYDRNGAEVIARSVITNGETYKNGYLLMCAGSIILISGKWKDSFDSVSNEIRKGMDMLKDVLFIYDNSFESVFGYAYINAMRKRK